MNSEWVNFRTIWNRESKRIGQKELARIVTPDNRPSAFNHSYIGKLGSGANQFTEEILEKFSKHMNATLATLLSESSTILPIQENGNMKDLQECLALAQEIPEFKRGILHYTDVLKREFKTEIEDMKKKIPARKSIFLK